MNAGKRHTFHKNGLGLNPAGPQSHGHAEERARLQ
jgi:hypothetical protein